MCILARITAFTFLFVPRIVWNTLIQRGGKMQSSSKPEQAVYEVLLIANPCFNYNPSHWGKIKVAISQWAGLLSIQGTENHEAIKH
jgi:hypothetical protein